MHQNFGRIKFWCEKGKTSCGLPRFKHFFSSGRQRGRIQVRLRLSFLYDERRVHAMSTKRLRSEIPLKTRTCPKPRLGELSLILFFSMVVEGRKHARANQLPRGLAYSLLVWTKSRTNYTSQAFATEIASKFACVNGLFGGMERKQH